MSIERRNLVGEGLEIRQDGGKTTLVGYAARFHDPTDKGTEYELWPGLSERVSPTAFDAMLGNPDSDVVGLFNHSMDHLLGRRSAGTMRLSKDARGLRYEIDLPDTASGRDVKTLAERGDLKGSSFSFRSKPNGKRDERQQDGTTHRWLTDLEVFDVGPVTIPAYKGTTAGMRAVQVNDADRKAWEAAESAERVRLHRLAKIKTEAIDIS
jgi:HK97 family phage prohead protease